MDLAERRELSHLMQQLADGNRGAFDPIFRSVWPLLRGFCGRFLSSSSDAEDAAQDALLKIFSRAHQYRHGSDALTWILTITAFECRTYRQKYKRKREGEYHDEGFKSIPSGGLDPESIAIRNDLSAAVHETLSQLKESDRETIIVTLLEGDRPDVPPATFRKRVQRAFERFKESWESKYDN